MIAKIRVLYWIGITMLFLPFFGIPSAWKTLGAIVIGVLLLWLTSGIRKNYKALKLKLRQNEDFVKQEAISLHD